MIPDQTLELIRERTDLVALLGQSMELRNSGRTLKGLCPFHKEKTPSFHVYPDKQIFKCFGCGVGGDVFTFLMKNQGLSFMEAVTQLGNAAGISVTTQKEDPQSARKEQLIQATEKAAAWFIRTLRDDNRGRLARQYLDQRGMEPDTANLFQCGYATADWDDLAKHLQLAGISEDVLIETGLCLRRPRQGTLYDRFRNRIMFPIMNVSGRIIGFSGRTLATDVPAKYLNSPESLIFKKNQVLYGLPQARAAIRESGQVLLTEGHIDVCLLHQYGWKETLGLQGTAFTEWHARTMVRLAPDCVLLFDGDRAGIQAAVRSLPLGLSEGLDMLIAHLPEGEDPASLLQKKGREALGAVLGKKQPLFDFKSEWLLSQGNDTPAKRAAVVSQMIGDIRGVKQTVLIDMLLQRLGTQMNIPQETLKDMLRDSARFTAAPAELPKESQKGSLVRLPPAEKELLSLALTEPRVHAELFNRLQWDWLKHGVTQKIMDTVWNCFSERQFSVDAVLKQWPSDPVISGWVEKAAEVTFGNAYEMALNDILKRLEEDAIHSRLRILQSEIEQKKGSAEVLALLKEFDGLTERRKSL